MSSSFNSFCFGKTSVVEDKPRGSKKDLNASIEICKNDLISEVVREFPNLQGVMGYYYATHAKKNKVIAEAILQQYMPQSTKENIPDKIISQLLALLDKLDTLIGFFVIGRQPTASKDPYALRWSALGIIRIIINGRHNINLNSLVEKAINSYKSQLKIRINSTHVGSQIIKFIMERYENFLKENQKYDMVLLNSYYIDYDKLNLTQINMAILELESFFKKSEAKTMLIAFKRVFNLIDDSKNTEKLYDLLDPSLFIKSEEKILYNKIKELDKATNKNTTHKDFNLLFSLLLELCKPINEFFAKVKINDDKKSIRENRLSLLLNLKMKVNKVLNFSIIIKGRDL